MNFMFFNNKAVLLCPVLVVLGCLRSHAMSAQDSINVEDAQDYSMLNMRRNSMFLEGIFLWPGVYYERAIPLEKNFALNVGAGLVPAIDVNRLWPSLRAGILMGTSKHMVDISLIRFVEPSNEHSLPSVMPFLGYRYVSPKGFHFRTGVLYYSKSNDFIPSLLPTYSFGYSF